MDAPNHYPQARLLISAIPHVDTLASWEVDSLAERFAHELMKAWLEGAKAGTFRAEVIMKGKDNA